ncbi:MAG: hypothetical protein ABI832_20910 [bacterium]
MQIPSPILAAVALFVAVTPALALDTWADTVQRGLRALSLKTADGELRLYCDPARVFGPDSNANVAVEFAKDADPTMVVFLAKTGEQARLAVKDGHAFQTQTDAAEWSKMVEMVKAGGSFAIVTSKASLKVETAPVPDLACQ